MKGIFITGTDTDVGKTYTACLIARQLQQSGITVVPRKPIESGCQKKDHELIPADALALKQAAAYSGTLTQICPYRFIPAISPKRAAQLAGQSINTADLARACTTGLNKDDFLLVEGAGGFYSPLCEDGLNADLAQALALPVVLVAEDRLGCINHILLSIQAIESRGLELSSIILNQTQASDSHSPMNNMHELSEMIDIPLLNINYNQCHSNADDLNMSWLPA